MSEIIFKVTRRLKVGEMVKIESGRITPLRDLLAKFMVDEVGKPIPFEKAAEILDDLDDLELAEVSKSFVADLQAFSVPPVGDGR